MEQETEKIFSISEYIEFLNAGLKEYRAKIIGEVSEVKMGPTGHVYFSLKDEKDGSVLSCIIWKSKYELYGIALEPGVKIVALGSPNVYAPSGRISFIADIIELAGEGALKKEYERLKKKLAEEGLFLESRKRQVPKYPQKIGVITSKQGAVIADFLSNIGKFGFKIKMIDSRVEGQEAVSDILSSIKTFKTHDLDVLVIIRGGGSLESMMAFNNELVVREVADFPVPVILGVGHHKDEPLAVFAADIAVSTPTAAANYLNESWSQALLLIERQERDIIGKYEKVLDNANLLVENSLGVVREAGRLIVKKYKTLEDKLRVALNNFKNALINDRMSLENSLRKSMIGFKALLLKANQNLEHSEKVVLLNNPEHQLSLGYSITAMGGRIVRKISDVKPGDDISVKVSDGDILAEVKQNNKK